MVQMVRLWSDLVKCFPRRSLDIDPTLIDLLDSRGARNHCKYNELGCLVAFEASHRGETEFTAEDLESMSCVVKVDFVSLRLSWSGRYSSPLQTQISLWRLIFTTPETDPYIVFCTLARGILAPTTRSLSASRTVYTTLGFFDDKRLR